MCRATVLSTGVGEPPAACLIVNLGAEEAAMRCEQCGGQRGAGRHHLMPPARRRLTGWHAPELGPLPTVPLEVCRNYTLLLHRGAHKTPSSGVANLRGAPRLRRRGLRRAAGPHNKQWGRVAWLTGAAGLWEKCQGAGKRCRKGRETNAGAGGRGQGGVRWASQHAFTRRVRDEGGKHECNE